MLNQYVRYATLLAMFTHAGISRADLISDLINGVQATKADLSFRLHYEDVNSNLASNASGATLRSRLKIETGEYQHSQFTFEIDNITTVTNKDFSNGVRNENTTIIADPDITEVNQAYIRFNGIPSTILQIGRQVIKLDSQRFVGDVDFRQNQQTYDALSALSKPIPKVSIYYAHVRAVNTILGRRANDGKQHHDSDLFNIRYEISELMEASAYHYRLENKDLPGQDHNTTGIRFSGSWPTDIVTPALHIDVAKQSTTGRPQNADIDYRLAELSFKRSRYQLLVGSELLGSDNSIAFQSPLATLHKFQGFTDQFLVTPADGLKDEYVTLRINLGPGRIELTGHEFETDQNHQSLGKEHSLGAWYRIGDQASVLVKWARFDGARSLTGLDRGDVRKYWLQFVYDL